jgi:hypothetical protein
MDRKSTAPRPIGLSDKPTPVTERIFQYEFAKRVYEIRQLEFDGPETQDPGKIEDLHKFAVEFQTLLPLTLRYHDPDMSWDEECPFLPVQREMLVNSQWTFLLALHRPYLFSSERSQQQVFRASLAILDCQKRLFELSSTHHRKLCFHNLCTFDAAALLSVVMISYPTYHASDFARIIQAISDGEERLSYIGMFVPLARSGAAALQNLLSRVKKVANETLSRNGQSQLSDSLKSQHLSEFTTPDADIESSLAFSASQSVESTPLSRSLPTPAFPDPRNWSFDVPIPLKDLTSGGLSNNAGFEMDLSGLDSQLWTGVQSAVPNSSQLGGEYEDNTFWTIMNQLN